MNKEKIYLSIIILLVLAITLFFSYNYISNINYQKGFNQGQNLTSEYLITRINEKGLIPIYIKDADNKTIIKEYSMNAICNSTRS